ncbi:MAG TPA: peptidoglycan recognition family protein [Candidatus Methylomirabilis sp.]|nr:peptidoglycan recognition family protein [Candidatus Methylomirabilis sp.]
MIRLRLFCLVLAASLVGISVSAPDAGDLPSRAQIPVGPEVAAAQATARRICVQMGVQTFRAPDNRSRIAKGDPALPPRLGGGVYVQLTGAQRNGYVQVRTLKGVDVWIPSIQSDSGNPSLCVAHASDMRVCSKDNAPQDVPVQADFEAPDAAPAAWVKRGSLIRLWGYFEERGQWAFVEAGGKVGFIRSGELCHEASAPPPSRATEQFHMILVAAKPDCYQWGRERGANEIRRIIIHNSEKSLESTAATFQECEPDRPTSAHVGIDRDGKIYRFVEDSFTAFHTGGTLYSGGFNSISLGIEVIAHDKPGFTFMTPQQERSLLDLIRFWANEYRITIPQDILQNSTRFKAYNDLEYWQAPITIHRLVSADRGTDCPRHIWADSIQGDEEFFVWRRKNLAGQSGE